MIAREGRAPGAVRRERRYFRLGLLAIAAVAVIVYAAWAKRVPFVDRYEVQAVVASSNQLRPGSPVRIAGVEVGRVSDISPGPGPGTTVSMEIEDEGRPIHTDATLRIRPRVFLEGSFIVQLEPGTPNAPVLEDGGTIPLPQTRVPVQLDQILSELDTPARDAIRTAFRETSTAFGHGGAEGLRRGFPHFAPVLRDVAIVAEAARGTEPHDLSDLVRFSSEVTATIAERDADLAGLVTAANRTAGALASERTALSAGVRELDGFLRELPSALDAIDRVAPDIERFVAALRPSRRLTPPALRRLRALRVELDALTGSGARTSDVARLLALLEPVLREVPRFALTARGVFPIVGPIAACVRDNAMPVLMSEVDDDALSTGRPVWQDFLHGMVGLASASQSFDGNGGWLRYLASAGGQTVSTGQLPGVDRLFGTAPEPIVGARPEWLGNGRTPPLAPEAPCSDQPLPDLRARTGRPMATSRTGSRGTPTLRELERLAGPPKPPRADAERTR